MFSNISWGSYWSALTVLLILYYAYVLLRYYRSNLRNRLVPSASFQFSKEVPGNETLLPVLQSFIDEATAYLEQASHAGAIKQEIIFALQQITAKYESIKNSPYQKAADSLIQFECESKCSIHLNEEEIGHVWMVR